MSFNIPKSMDELAIEPAAVPCRESQAILARQSERESNARTYARRLALALESASGVHVKDVDGKVYIDCLAGAGTLALGHNHPRVLDALRSALDRELPLHTLDLTTPVKDRFVETLFESLPESMRKPGAWKIQFCSPSGADAVEAALKIAKTATGRSSIVAFHGAYHGMTHGAMAVTGSVAVKENVRALVPEVHFFPYPYPYRCPFGIGDKEGKVAATYLERVLQDPESGITKPAAVILEVVQGEGGVIPAPTPWLNRVRELTRALGIVLIIDEVQTGIGRTGSMFAFEQAGIEPDILVVSKAVGGSLPLAVTIYRADLDVWRTGAHTGTFRGNQLAMAAGRVTLEIVREPEFLANVRRVGGMLGDTFREAAKELPVIGDVRQRGLMIGLEMVNPESAPDALGSYPAWAELAARIQQAALERGLIVELGGRHGAVVRLLPPLILDEKTATQVSERLFDATRAAWNELRSGALH